jgi:hypothetical protein
VLAAGRAGGGARDSAHARLEARQLAERLVEARLDGDRPAVRALLERNLARDAGAERRLAVHRRQAAATAAHGERLGHRIGREAPDAPYDALRGAVPVGPDHAVRALVAVEVEQRQRGPVDRRPAHERELLRAGPGRRLVAVGDQLVARLALLDHRP